MPIFRFNGHEPKLGEGCFIAPGAIVAGEVYFGKDVSFWFNSVARGDVASITVGDGSNIQDLVMLHVTDDMPLVIGRGVSVAHQATLHSCTVEDNCLIGMGAVILDKAVIGKNSIVAAGSVVPPGKEFPENSFIIGSPAVLKRELSDQEQIRYGEHYKSYLVTKESYLNDADFNRGSIE